MTDTETMEMRWEWFDRSDEKGPTWKVYDHDIQTTLNDSVKNNKKSVNFFVQYLNILMIVLHLTPNF